MKTSVELSDDIVQNSKKERRNDQRLLKMNFKKMNLNKVSLLL